MADLLEVAGTIEFSPPHAIPKKRKLSEMISCQGLTVSSSEHCHNKFAVGMAWKMVCSVVPGFRVCKHFRRYRSWVLLWSLMLTVLFLELP